MALLRYVGGDERTSRPIRGAHSLALCAPPESRIVRVMRIFPTQRVLLVEDVRADERAARRAGRIVAALGCGRPDVISREEATRLWRDRPAKRPHPFHRRTGAFDYSAGWTLILDTYVDDDRPGDGVPRATFRDGGAQMEGRGVCRSALEIHGAIGCYHRCAYCHCDPFFVVACDLESLAERLPAYFARHPAQRLYKFDNLTDTICLEPEWGSSELLVPLFGATEDKYLLLYTKSDNVDHLLPLEHNGHTIVNWSMSTLTQSRMIETGAPDTRERIAAMAKCRDAGYVVRVRISPVVPLERWRAEVVDLVEELFAAAAPDSVTVDVVGWCVPEAFEEIVDVSLLDEAFRSHLRRTAGRPNPEGEKYLFDHELRRTVLSHVVAEVKRRSPGTPVALCNETRRMWGDLGDLLGATPENYVCCCGPDCAPGAGG